MFLTSDVVWGGYDFGRGVAYFEFVDLGIFHPPYTSIYNIRKGICQVCCKVLDEFGRKIARNSCFVCFHSRQMKPYLGWLELSYINS